MTVITILLASCAGRFWLLRYSTAINTINNLIEFATVEPYTAT